MAFTTGVSSSTSGSSAVPQQSIRDIWPLSTPVWPAHTSAPLQVPVCSWGALCQLECHAFPAHVPPAWPVLALLRPPFPILVSLDRVGPPTGAEAPSVPCARCISRVLPESPLPHFTEEETGGGQGSAVQLASLTAGFGLKSVMKPRSLNHL